MSERRHGYLEPLAAGLHKVGLQIAGCRAQYTAHPSEVLENIQSTTRRKMPNFLPCPDVPVQIFSKDACKAKVICPLKLQSACCLLTRPSKRRV